MVWEMAHCHLECCRRKRKELEVGDVCSEGRNDRKIEKGR